MTPQIAVSRTVVIRGDAFTDDHVRELMTWAHERGLTAYDLLHPAHIVVAQVWSDEKMAATLLSEAMGVGRWTTEEHREWFYATTRRMGIRTLAELVRLPFERFMGARNVPWAEDLRDAFGRKMILHFMIKYGLSFPDLEPAVFFATPITSKDLLSVRAYNCLKHAHIDWMEMLAFLTSRELKKLRNLGDKTFNELVELLPRLGISLKT